MVTPYKMPRVVKKYKEKPCTVRDYAVCCENNGNFSVNDRYVVVDVYKRIEQARREKARQEALHPHDNFVIIGRI